MIQIKDDRNWKEQQKITLKGFLKSRVYWLYSIFLIVTFILIRNFLYQGFPTTCKYIFNAIAFLSFLLPYFSLELYRWRRESHLKGEGDVWLFLDDYGFGRESDFVKVTYRWDQIDTIKEERDFLHFMVKGKLRFVIDKYKLPEETIASLKELFARVPVENIKLL